jgi:hypothetical protein
MRTTLATLLLLGALPATVLVAQQPVHIAIETTSLVTDEARQTMLGVGRQRTAQRVSTQRIVVISGSAAELSAQRTVVGRFGYAASAGPAIWVQAEALPDGRVRMRLWSTIGDVRSGPYGTVLQEVPIEAQTEVVVESGTPVMVASVQGSESSRARGVLVRSASSAAAEGWITVTARVVEHAADAFPR